MQVGTMVIESGTVDRRIWNSCGTLSKEMLSRAPVDHMKLQQQVKVAFYESKNTQKYKYSPLAVKLSWIL